MDIEEIKKYSKNKIQADELVKQVRQQIKETTWDKQNLREGFTETFKPLISQFEDPGKDSKKQNIFTQNQKMLQNQLALTEGVRNNQLTLKGIKDQQGHFNRALEYLENLADMEEMPGAIEDGEDDEKDDQARAPTPSLPKSTISTPSKSTISTQTSQVEEAPIAKFSIQDLNKNLENKESQDILKNNGYENLPSYYFNKDISEISSLINNVNTRLQDFANDLRNTALFVKEGEFYKAQAKNSNPQTKTINNIKNFNTLSTYSTNLTTLLKFKKQSGSGLFSTPKELLRRLELLNGSLAAGNNGVLPEFIQISHRLRDLGILTNKQLNALLRKVI